MIFKKLHLFAVLVSSGLLVLSLTACTNSLATTTSPVKNESDAVGVPETSQPTSILKTRVNKPTDIPSLPLSISGPYHVGIRRNINFVDTSRNDRSVSLTIWYPAIKNSDSDPVPSPDALPDMSAAPYPLLISSSKVGFIFADLLVSYGFTYVGINRIDTYEFFSQEAFDQPLDILFALDQISQAPIEGLEGMLNTDMVGTLGYSFDGTNSLFLSGARVYPDYYLSYCEQAQTLDPPLEDWYLNFYCNLVPNWSELTAYLGNEITDSEDGLWQPITDDRIKAVMPMAPDGTWFLGEKGLVTADRAILMIQASRDSEYQPTEGKFIIENLGSKDKTMVSFIGQHHMMIYDPKEIAKMGHFAVAFFSHQLQGKEDMEYFYSEEFIKQYPDLAYGFFEEE